MMRGVTRITNSRLARLPWEERKNWPMKGRSPRMGHLVTACTSASEITPVKINVCPSRTRIFPVSRERLLIILIFPHRSTKSTSIAADICGDREKVTKPLSSILSTLAPKVRPAFVNSGSQKILPFSPSLTLYDVTRRSQTETNASFTRSRPTNPSEPIAVPSEPRISPSPS